MAITDAAKSTLFLGYVVTFIFIYVIDTEISYTSHHIWGSV